ncbi:MAG: SlyX family protein [Pseudomonadota bacterium]
MTSDRIEALEAAVAHAEAAIEDLSEVARRQSEEIDALRRELGKLVRTLEAALEEAPPSPEADRPPPHY